MHNLHHLLVNGNWVIPKLDALEVCLTGNEVEPWMLADLIDCEPLLRVSFQDFVKNVFGVV